MVEFTKEELLEIASWAMDKADAAMASKTMYMKTFNYELAKGIFKKAHGEYCKLEGKG